MQFGLDYGITNQRGRIPKEEALAILKHAAERKVAMLDTAHAYGDSETVIGESPVRDRFQIVSKLPPCGRKEAASKLAESLRRLGVRRIHGYLFHDFPSYERAPDVWNVLEAAAAEGKIDRAGFSLYHPDQAEKILQEGLGPGIIQLPYSLFDRRFERLLPDLKELGWEIHVRSVFLQGLLLSQPASLTGALAKAAPKLESLHALARQTGLPLAALCLALPIHNKHVDRVVIGIERLSQLDENLDAYALAKKAASLLPGMEGLREEDEDVILPTRWTR